MIGMIYGNNREDKGIRENDERKRRKWHLCYSKKWERKINNFSREIFLTKHEIERKKKRKRKKLCFSNI